MTADDIPTYIDDFGFDPILENWPILLVAGMVATKICFWVGVFRLVTWLFSGAGEQGNITVINEATPTDTATEIEKYHDLFEKGIISQEEFNQKKSELL